MFTRSTDVILCSQSIRNSTCSCTTQNGTVPKRCDNCCRPNIFIHMRVKEICHELTVHMAFPNEIFSLVQRCQVGTQRYTWNFKCFYLYFSLNLSNIYSSLLFFSKTYLHLLNICLFHLDPKWKENHVL